MGAKLAKYYDFVAQEGGIQGKMRLAMMTNVPSTKAATEADTPELVNKFRAAIKEITGKDAPAV